MKKSFCSKITYWLGIVSIGLVVGLGIQFAQAAWTNPTYPLPIQNVEAPVNVSGNTQTKAGDLIVDDFGTNTITTTGNFKVLTNGNVGIGTTSPGTTLDVNGIFYVGSSGTNNRLRMGDYGSITVINSGEWGKPLQLEASNVYIPNGNVGIGVTNPANKLEVAGDIIENNRRVVSYVPGDGANTCNTLCGGACLFQMEFSGSDEVHPCSIRSSTANGSICLCK